MTKAKIIEYAALAAILFGAMPYYINTEVERRVNELSASAPDPVPVSETPAVVELSTKVDSLSEGQARIEGKVDRFADAFRAYLERQAQ